MIKKTIKLLALLLFVFTAQTVKAGSFFVSETNVLEKSSDHIIPLIYVEDLEYYNHTKTKAYTSLIIEQLTLSPDIIIAEDKDIADYILIPKVTQSRIEKINVTNSRYSMSVVVELWAKGGVRVHTEQQNRYIIINNTENPQEMAKKLLMKLLNEAIGNLSLKIKNNQLKLG